MLLLPGEKTPESAAELEAALRAALAALLPSPAEVVVEGEWPVLRKIVIDFSGEWVPKQLAMTPVGGAVLAEASTDRLELRGDSVRVMEAEATLRVEAEGVRFFIREANGGGRSLGLASVRQGKLEASAGRDSLERLICTLARKAAEPHGVEIDTVKLETEGGGEVLAFKARVIARKLFLSTTVEITGRISVDKTLVVKPSELACSGTGMIGGIACNLIRPQLEQLNGRSFPLTDYALGNARVQSLRLDPGEPLKITAEVGGGEG